MFVAAIVVGGIDVKASANASPYGGVYDPYLNCLNAAGFTPPSPIAAISVGIKSSIDAKNGVPVATIREVLLERGYGEVGADAILSCAAEQTRHRSRSRGDDGYGLEL